MRGKEEEERQWVGYQTGTKMYKYMYIHVYTCSKVS